MKDWIIALAAPLSDPMTNVQKNPITGGDPRTKLFMDDADTYDISHIFLDLNCIASSPFTYSGEQ